MNKRAMKELLEWHDRQRQVLPVPDDRAAERLTRQLIDSLYERFVNPHAPGPDGDGSVGDPASPGGQLAAILDRYRFKAAENAPTREEEALDPSLLGSLFENLLARSSSGNSSRSLRDRTGTYYTSSEIARYMAKRSLAAYLRERLSTGFGTLPDLGADLHRLFADGDDQPSRLEQVRREAVRLLGACAVFDPACGSGAFPLAVLHVMTGMLRKLDPDLTIWRRVQLRKAEQIADFADRRAAISEIDRVFSRERPDFARQYFLIRDCLYGVDIQPMAVRICRMRLLLSLYSEEDRGSGRTWGRGAEYPELDLYSRFVSANLLIPLDKPASSPESEDPILLSLRERLMRARRRLSLAEPAGPDLDSESLPKLQAAERALSVRLRDALIGHGYGAGDAQRLADWSPYETDVAASFFDKDWMLGMRNGFDIVIGNPPYLGERKNKADFRAVQRSLTGKYYLGRMDYFYFFFHVGIDILREAGIGAYITTNYYLTALGARKLREDLRNRATLLEMVNFNEARIFAGAAGQHNLITLFRKGRLETCARVKEIGTRGILSGDELSRRLQPDRSDLLIAQSELWDGEESYLRLGGQAGGGLPINRALDLLKRASTDDLGRICRPLIGLESSLDEVYTADLAFFRGIVQEDAEWAHIKPFFKNSDIGRYRAADRTNRYVLYLHEQVPNIRALPGIYRYLQLHEERIKGRKGANLRGAYRRGNWWVLNTPRLDMDFEDEKIVTPYRSKTTRFALTSKPWYASRDVYYIVRQASDVSLHYILALLNSRLYYQWLYHRGKRKGEMLELYAKPLREIPIKRIDAAGQRPFIQLAKLAALVAADPDPGKLGEVQRAIDALVFELIYGEHMRERGIDTAAWIQADLREVLGECDFESASEERQADQLRELCRRWSNPDGEVRRRMERFADRSPDILKPILD